MPSEINPSDLMMPSDYFINYMCVDKTVIQVNRVRNEWLRSKIIYDTTNDSILKLIEEEKMHLMKERMENVCLRLCVMLLEKTT